MRELEMGVVDCQTGLTLTLWKSTSKSTHILYLELGLKCWDPWFSQIWLSGVKLTEIIIEGFVKYLSFVKYNSVLCE